MARRSSIDVREGRKVEVLFNAPICMDISVPIKPLTKGSDYEPSWEEISQCVKDCADDGFEERSIVARRGQPWQANSPAYWGVVRDVSRHKPMMGTYAPLTVLWCGEKETSKHFAEELWLIHGPISAKAIHESIRRQELE